MGGASRMRLFLRVVLFLALAGGWAQAATIVPTDWIGGGSHFGPDYSAAADNALLAAYGVGPTHAQGMLYDVFGQPSEFIVCNDDGSHPGSWCAGSISSCPPGYRKAIAQCID